MSTVKNNSVKIIIIVVILSVILLLGNVFQILTRTNEKNKILAQVTNLTSEKSSLEEEFKSSQERIDYLTENNKNLDLKLTNAKDTIKLLQRKIYNILNKDRLTPDERANVKNLIAKLNSTITDLNSEIEKLKQEIQDLTNQNQELTSEMNNIVNEKQRIADSLVLISKELDDFKKSGSVLHASNFVLKAFTKGKKGKTSETQKVKEANSLNIDFNIDANPLAEAGNREIYINILTPDGNTLTENDIATFTNKNGEEISYSQKLDIDYLKDQANPVNVNIPLIKGKKGTYTVQVYFDGDMIGNSQIELK